jgi:hypothetical protein
VDARERVYRGEIDHPPWSLHVAEAEVGKETLTTPLGIQLPVSPPLLHFSRHQEVSVWPLTAVAK